MLLVESLLLCLAAGAAGTLLAYWALALVGQMAAEDLPQLRDVRMDGRVVLFALGATLLTTVVFGLLPALRLSRARANAVAGAQARLGRSGMPRVELRQWLIGGEIALALVLCIAAGLMVRSFGRLVRVDPGFEARDLTAFSIRLPERRYPGPEQRAAYFGRLLEEVRGIPGVGEAVLAGNVPPRFSIRLSPPIIDGREAEPGSRRLVSSEVGVSPGYFAVVRTPVVEGRAFAEADRGSASQLLIVNRAFAVRYWPGESAIGKRVRFDQSEPWATVIGVAADVKALGLSDDPGRLQLYRLLPDFGTPFATVVVRSPAPLGELLPLLKRRVWALDPDLVVREPASVEHLLAATIARERLLTRLFGAFAVLALGLAAVGVYGVMSLTVGLRVREIGVRLALGGTGGQVIRGVLGQAAGPVAGGVAVGLAAAFWLTRFMERLLFDIDTGDPLTYVTVALALCLLAGLASYLPARRVLRSDPVGVLRGP